MQHGFSQAAENNKTPILQQLKQLFALVNEVLEIGSGTGQHAAYFAANLPHLNWHTSDLAVNHPSILAIQQELALPNLHKPFEFCIGKTIGLQT